MSKSLVLIIIFYQEQILQFFFRQGGSKKKDLSDLLNNSDEFKKPREDSLEDSLVLKCSALGYVFAGSLKAPDALKSC